MIRPPSSVVWNWIENEWHLPEWLFGNELKVQGLALIHELHSLVVYYVFTGRLLVHFHMNGPGIESVLKRCWRYLRAFLWALSHMETNRFSFGNRLNSKFLFRKATETWRFFRFLMIPPVFRLDSRWLHFQSWPRENESHALTGFIIKSVNRRIRRRFSLKKCTEE